MNKIIEFIKKNYILLGIILILGFIIAIFSTRKESTPIKNVDTGVFWKLQYDSLQTSSLNEIIALSKAIQANEASYSLTLKNATAKQKIKADSTENIARKDSDINCNKALDDKNSLIGGLVGIIKSDSTQISECHKEVALKDSVNILSKEDIEFLKKANEEYNNANAILQKQIGRNFIEKHGLETGFGAAVILATFAKFVLFK